MRRENLRVWTVALAAYYAAIVAIGFITKPAVEGIATGVQIAVGIVLGLPVALFGNWLANRVARLPRFNREEN